jgi:hypothetical protein
LATSRLEDIPQDVIHFRLSVDSGADGEVPRTEVERRVRGDLDIGTSAIEKSSFEIDAVIDPVVALPGMVAAISLKFPVTDKS